MSSSRAKGLNMSAFVTAWYSDIGAFDWSQYELYCQSNTKLLFVAVGDNYGYQET